LSGSPCSFIENNWGPWEASVATLIPYMRTIFTQHVITTICTNPDNISLWYQMKKYTNTSMDKIN
jgi:hypothetical protein